MFSGAVFAYLSFNDNSNYRNPSPPLIPNIVICTF